MHLAINEPIQQESPVSMIDIESVIKPAFLGYSELEWGSLPIYADQWKGGFAKLMGIESLLLDHWINAISIAALEYTFCTLWKIGQKRAVTISYIERTNSSNQTFV